MRTAGSGSSAHGSPAVREVITLPSSQLGSVIKGTDVVRKSSLLGHTALAPSRNADRGTWALFVLLGVAAAVAGAAAFPRRDIEYE